ncbi:uncharacterized protein LOC131645940 [Vicia villosa]|uniref:uncharacterized protein LOC131645940 n=1 Tax=Vicia villosa TaxID=3911 RepID=UPI00273BC4FF|nr:uncharacterized protein LOC131645940 [Vicia villosa]
MENDQVTSKEMKVEIPSKSESSNVGQGGLMRQPSMTKTNCLCSPTTHPGSFRCRLHRSPSLQRTKSMEPGSSVSDQGSTLGHDSIVGVDKNRVD